MITLEFVKIESGFEDFSCVRMVQDNGGIFYPPITMLEGKDKEEIIERVYEIIGQLKGNLGVHDAHDDIPGYIYVLSYGDDLSTSIFKAEDGKYFMFGAFTATLQHPAKLIKSVVYNNLTGRMLNHYKNAKDSEDTKQKTALLKKIRNDKIVDGYKDKPVKLEFIKLEKSNSRPCMEATDNKYTYYWHSLMYCYTGTSKDHVIDELYKTIEKTKSKFDHYSSTGDTYIYVLSYGDDLPTSIKNENGKYYLSAAVYGFEKPAHLVKPLNLSSTIPTEETTKEVAYNAMREPLQVSFVEDDGIKECFQTWQNLLDVTDDIRPTYERLEVSDAALLSGLQTKQPEDLLVDGNPTKGMYGIPLEYLTPGVEVKFDVPQTFAKEKQEQFTQSFIETNKTTFPVLFGPTSQGFYKASEPDMLGKFAKHIRLQRSFRII